MAFLRFSFPVVFLVLLTGIQPLSAQRITIANTFGVGPRIGWYESNSAEEGAMYYGFQAQARLGSTFGLELALEYRDTEVFSAGTIDLQRLRADVMYIPITASLLVFIPVGAWLNPYGVAGVGWYYTITDYQLLGAGSAEIHRLLQDENNFEPGYHFGLGLEIPLSQNVTIHADARYLFLGTRIRSIRDVVTLETDTHNSDGVMISGGVMLFL